MIPNYCSSCGRRTNSTLFCDELTCHRNPKTGMLKEHLVRKLDWDEYRADVRFASLRQELARYPHDYCPELYAKFEELTKPTAFLGVDREAHRNTPALDLWKSELEAASKAAAKFARDAFVAPPVAVGQIWEFKGHHYRVDTIANGAVTFVLIGEMREGAWLTLYNRIENGKPVDTRFSFVSAGTVTPKPEPSGFLTAKGFEEINAAVQPKVAVGQIWEWQDPDGSNIVPAGTRVTVAKVTLDEVEFAGESRLSMYLSNSGTPGRPRNWKYIGADGVAAPKPAPGQVWKHPNTGDNRLLKQLNDRVFSSLGCCKTVEINPEYGWTLVRDFDRVVKVGQKWKWTGDTNRFLREGEVFSIDYIDHGFGIRAGSEAYGVGINRDGRAYGTDWQLVEDVP